MRKRIIDPESKNSLSSDTLWLDLGQQAEVELSSEDEEHPIENAFDLRADTGWRASRAGEQLIRIIFNEPQTIQRIRLLFEENQQSRTQEFVLRWSTDRDGAYQEILRQQYNFSPPHTTQEEEDYTVNLTKVTAIELHIQPDINGGKACASLTQWQMSAEGVRE